MAERFLPNYFIGPLGKVCHDNRELDVAWGRFNDDFNKPIEDQSISIRVAALDTNKIIIKKEDLTPLS